MIWQPTWTINEQFPATDYDPAQERLLEHCVNRTGVTVREAPGMKPLHTTLDGAIHLPSIRCFPTYQDYYRIAFHEIAHATREQLGRSIDRSLEECIADTVGYRLVMTAHTAPATGPALDSLWKSHCAYLHSWDPAGKHGQWTSDVADRIITWLCRGFV